MSIVDSTSVLRSLVDGGASASRVADRWNRSRKAYDEGDIRAPNIPGGQNRKPQREQTPEEKKKRKRRHQRNKARDNMAAKKRYHKRYKRKRKMVERREDYRKDPRKYKRKAPREYERPEKTAVAKLHAAHPIPADKTQLRKVAQGLPVRTAGRLWYHGSPKRFEGFKTYEGHTFGKGSSEVPLFFSPSKSFAKMYAMGPEGTIYAARLKWRQVFDGAELYRESRYWPPEYEDLTPKGKALYDDLVDGKVFSGVGEDDLLDGYPSLWAQILRMDYDIIEDAAFKRWLKKNGYDAAYVTGDGEQNVFVFSPSQVEIVEVEGLRGKTASRRIRKVAGGFRRTIDEIEEETGLEAKVEAGADSIKIELKRGAKMVGYFRASTVSPDSFQWKEAPLDCKEAWSQIGEPPVWIVRGAEWFDHDLRGKGFGKLLYKALFSHIASEKGVVGPNRCSGGNTSPDAQRVWKSLRSMYPKHGPLIDLRKTASAARVASRHREAGDIILYDQHNPANNEIKQPGPDVNYRAVGPTTYTTEPDEKMGIVPGGGMPNRHMDDAPPASSRVVPDSMTETLQQNYMRSASATVPQILSNCGPKVTGRSGDVKYRRKRLSPSGMSTWTAQSVTDPSKSYTVRVKPIRKDKRLKAVAKMPVRVSCSCPFWRWQGPEHWAKVNDYLYGKPRGTASVPVIRDPKSKHWACKHVISVLQLVKNYRYASDGGSQWSYDGPLVAMPDEGRVAVRHLMLTGDIPLHRFLTTGDPEEP